MKSMTGFGRGNVSIDNFSVTVDIKTVNNRFLDVNLRLPNELQPIEADLKRLITDRLARGRVEINLNYERSEEIVYEINRPLIAGHLSALNELKDTFDLSGEVDLNYVARIPNAFQSAKADLNEDYSNAIKNSFEIALTELESMREVEGASLNEELVFRLNAIESHIPIIENETENVVEEYQERLSKKISDMLEKSDSQIEIDQGRLAQEVAYLATRSDISEEVTRLRSHIEQFRSIMGEDKDVGKRLDFLTQELNREANTIASKTQNLTVKESSLTIKAEIEKIREQVQNVE